MSFRDRMRVGISNAEITVFEELQRRNLSRGMTTQEGFSFEGGRVKGTWVDFYWESVHYAVFLDGQPHLKEHQGRRDELVTMALDGMGIRVDRFPYKAPLAKCRLKDICDRIEERLGELGNKGSGPMIGKRLMTIWNEMSPPNEGSTRAVR